MNRQQEDSSLENIDRVRRLVRRVADECGNRGVTVEDCAVGALYGTVDIAERHAGPGMGAVEWLRTAADMLEDQLMRTGR